MKIAYDGANANLAAAAAFVNQLGSNERFWELVRSKTDYSHTTVDGGEIEARLRGNSQAMTVKLWQPKLYQRFAYRNTVAFADDSHPHVLFYHDKFIGNSVGEMVNTLVHEYIHDADDDGVFGHGNNKPAGKDDSPPYWIGNEAERLYNETNGLGPQIKGSGLEHVRGKAGDGTIL